VARWAVEAARARLTQRLGEGGGGWARAGTAAVASVVWWQARDRAMRVARPCACGGGSMLEGGMVCGAGEGGFRVRLRVGWCGRASVCVVALAGLAVGFLGDTGHGAAT